MYCQFSRATLEMTSCIITWMWQLHSRKWWLMLFMWLEMKSISHSACLGCVQHLLGRKLLHTKQDLGPSSNTHYLEQSLLTEPPRLLAELWTQKSLHLFQNLVWSFSIITFSAKRSRWGYMYVCIVGLKQHFRWGSLGNVNKLKDCDPHPPLKNKKKPFCTESGHYRHEILQWITGSTSLLF